MKFNNQLKLILNSGIQMLNLGSEDPVFVHIRIACKNTYLC